MEIATKREIKYCNASKRIPESNESVDLIYACHIVEHLDQEETSIFFNECNRVLKPGGIVRVVVPDFDKLVDSYKSNNDILTVKINKRRMKIELSLAWFLNNKRNIIHLTPIEAKEAFERLQGELESEIGLKSNILDAKFAMLDLAREIKTDKPLREYVPLFSNREYYRSKKKRFDDTHYIGNNSHTIAIYDKKNHLVHKGKDVSDLPDNFIRF